MAKITDYPKIQTLVKNNVFLADGDNGTKGIIAGDMGDALLGLMTTKQITDHIKLEELETHKMDVTKNQYLFIRNDDQNIKYPVHTDLLYYMIDKRISSMNSPADITLKRNIWRGASLGSVVTDEHWSAISSGKFKGLFLGDYWTIGNKKWVIVDFDYWYKYVSSSSDNKVHTHHVVVMPSDSLYSTKMNATNTTETGFANSLLATEGLENAKTLIYGNFGESHILSHKELYTNSVVMYDEVAKISSVWADVKITIPNQIMIFGCHPMGLIFNDQTTNYRQLSAFRVSLDPLIGYSNSNYTTWLRDPYNSTGFVCLNNSNTSYANASNNEGVRPVFALCA